MCMYKRGSEREREKGREGGREGEERERLLFVYCMLLKSKMYVFISCISAHSSLGFVYLFINN